jgi:hypothetical protein
MDDLDQFPLLQAGVYRVTQDESDNLTIAHIFSPDVLPTL